MVRELRLKACQNHAHEEGSATCPGLVVFKGVFVALEIVILAVRPHAGLTHVVIGVNDDEIEVAE